MIALMREPLCMLPLSSWAPLGESRQLFLLVCVFCLSVISLTKPRASHPKRLAQIPFCQQRQIPASLAGPPMSQLCRHTCVRVLVSPYVPEMRTDFSCCCLFLSPLLPALSLVLLPSCPPPPIRTPRLGSMEQLGLLDFCSLSFSPLSSSLKFTGAWFTLFFDSLFLSLFFVSVFKSCFCSLSVSPFPLLSLLFSLSFSLSPYPMLLPSFHILRIVYSVDFLKI